MSIRTSLVWSAARQTVTRLGTLVAFMVAANLLPKSELGLFAAALAVIAVADIFAEAGMGDAVIQSGVTDREVLLAATYLNAAMATVAAAAIILAGPLIANLMNAPGLVAVLPFLCLSLVLNALAYVPQAVLRREMDFKPLAKVSFLAAGTSSALAIACLLAGFGVWSLVVQNVTSAVITVVGVLRASSIRLGWSPPGRARPLLRFGSGVILTKGSAYLATRSIELLVPAVLGPSALALYIMGSRLTAVASQFTSAVMTEVSYANLARLRDQRPALLEAYYASVQTGSAVVMPVFFGLASVAPELTALFYGANGAGSETVLVLTAIVAGLQVIAYHNYLAVQVVGRPHVVGVMLLLVGAAGVAAAALVSGDLVRMVAAFSAAQASLLLLSTLACRAHVGISISRLARTAAPFGTACLVMFAASFWLRGALAPVTAGSHLLALLLLVPVLALVYGLVATICDRRAVAAVLKTVLGRAHPPR